MFEEQRQRYAQYLQDAMREDVYKRQFISLFVQDGDIPGKGAAVADNAHLPEFRADLGSGKWILFVRFLA